MTVMAALHHHSDPVLVLTEPVEDISPPSPNPEIHILKNLVNHFFFLVFFFTQKENSPFSS